MLFSVQNNENKSALHLEQEVEELQEKLGQVNETGTSTQKEPEAAVPAPGTGGESVSGETPQALQEVMEKLEVSESWNRPRRAGVGRSLLRGDPIILAPERPCGPPGGEGGPEGACGETRTPIHAVLEGEMPSVSGRPGQGRGSCRAIGGAPGSEPRPPAGKLNTL